jgi:hypothetical protein
MKGYFCMYYSAMKVLTVVLAICMLSVIGCSNDHDARVAPAMSSDYAMSSAAYAPSTEIESYSRGSSETRIQINGNISLEVQNVPAAVEQTRALVIQYGGSITSSDSGESFNRYANISALIPRDSFYELIGAVKNIAMKVTNENINSNDVTEEFVDTEAKLNVMKETEKRFIILLSETANVEEVMSVERELMRLRGEIDSLEGRMKYLSKTTDNSVLNIYMIEEVSITGSGWSFSESLDNSVRAMVSFSKHIANFLIGVIVFSPILIGVVFIVFLVYKYGKRYVIRRKK